MTENARRSSWRTYLSLAVLLGASIGVSYLVPDPWQVPLILLLAGAQGLMMMLNFMRVRLHGPTLWIVAGAAFVWLGILFALTLGDYLGRQIVL
jgi:cytochrome c oxidase subunit IV